MRRAAFVLLWGVAKALTQRARRFATERDGICVWDEGLLGKDGYGFDFYEELRAK